MRKAPKNLISKINPPDIRKFYRFHRQIVHFFVHSAAKANDGHFDKVFYGDDGQKIPVRIYPPDNTASRLRIIVFFHGGGWVIDDLDRYHKVCRQLAEKTGSYVISVGYRLAPEHKYPDGFNDCYCAAKSVFSYAKARGMSTNDIILAGDSAGGNLAAAVSLKARDTGDFKVRRQILIYPATSCEYDSSSPYKSVHEKATGCLLTTERMRGYLDLYLKDSSQCSDPYVAPIKASNLSGMPETLIITAENDPLRDEGEDFGRRIYLSGGNVRVFRIKEAYHGFFGTDLIRNPHARKAVSIIMYYIRLTD